MLEYLKLYLFSILIKRSESTDGASPFKILKVSIRVRKTRVLNHKTQPSGF